RVATLVAEGAPPGEIFAAVVDEVDSILELQGVELVRYEGDGTGMIVAASGDHPFLSGTVWTLEGPSVMARVSATSRTARVDDYAVLDGPVAEAVRAAGFRCAIGAPIIVDGALWGTMIAFSTSAESISARVESRLTQFTALVGTAISNATARADLIASRVRL